MRTVIRKGVESGELRQSALDEFPYILASPIVFSVLWKILFDQQEKLDTDRFIEEHLAIVLNTIRNPEK
jgi:hypothetical protein